MSGYDSHVAAEVLTHTEGVMVDAMLDLWRQAEQDACCGGHARIALLDVLADQKWSTLTMAGHLVAVTAVLADARAREESGPVPVETEWRRYRQCKTCLAPIGVPCTALSAEIVDGRPQGGVVELLKPHPNRELRVGYGR